MLSPIRTVLIHYPLRSFFTILIMICMSIYSYKKIKIRYVDGNITKRKGIIFWLLINYVMALLFFTVIGRRSWEYYRYNLEFGYSYCDVFLKGDQNLLTQIIANIAVFIPIGFLGSFLFRKSTYIKCMLCGVMLSVSIEFLQFVLKRGCCEFDDIISNSLGIIIGCVVVMILKKISGRKKEKNVF